MRSFPSKALKYLEFLYHHLDERIAFLTEKVEDIIDGAEKKKISGWWLNHIDSQVNSFLQSLGFDFNAIPDNYLDVPPSDFEAIQSNLQIITTLMKPDAVDEVGKEITQLSELDEFLDAVTSDVYVKLDGFVKDLIFILNCKWKEVIPDIIISDFQRDHMQKDLLYLQKMKEMDEEIKEMRRSRKVEGKQRIMSDVVPIGGLIMARFHILECELRTVQMRWKHLSKTTSSQGILHQSLQMKAEGPFQNCSEAQDISLLKEKPRTRRFKSHSLKSIEQLNQFAQYVLATSPPFAASSCLYLLKESTPSPKFQRPHSDASVLQSGYQAFPNLIEENSNDEYSF